MRYSKWLLAVTFICSLPLPVAGQFGIIGFRHGNATNIVVIGDSLSAGFQNYSLYDSTSAPAGTTVPPGGQKWGFAAQIATQAGADLNLPLISYPGLPPVLTLSADGTLNRGTVVGTRETQTLTTQTKDLSVPGFTVANALGYSVSAASLADPSSAGLEDVLALEILGYPSLSNLANSCGVAPNADGSVTLSEVGCAVQLKPSLVIVSIGANDVLQAILDGLPPTSLATFQAEYQQLISDLAPTGAQIVVANIPDVTKSPILQSYAQFEARCGSAPTGATAADYVVPDITASLTSFSVCTNYTVIPAALVTQVQTLVQQYNLAIAGIASSVKAPVVDLYGLVDELAAQGYEANGMQLSTQYLGGLFSLDGIHPSNTGYAIIANEFISVIDRDLHMLIPLVDVGQVAATDPLIITPPAI